MSDWIRDLEVQLAALRNIREEVRTITANEALDDILNRAIYLIDIHVAGFPLPIPEKYRIAVAECMIRKLVQEEERQSLVIDLLHNMIEVDKIMQEARTETPIVQYHIPDEVFQKVEREEP